jgi:tRNA pseudouridine55 synthase
VTLLTEEAGKTYIARKLYSNMSGNFWYQITLETGETAYLYNKHCQFVEPVDTDIVLIGGVAPGRLEQGQDFEIRSRRIMIYANTVTGIDLAAGEVEFDVTCSKGTYIRTICDDIGRTLGCGAVMSSLERTASGYFRIGEAYGIDELVRMTDEELAGCIIPMDRTLVNLGTVELDDNRFSAFVNGNPSGSGFHIRQDSRFVSGSHDKYNGLKVYRVYCSDTFLGTGYVMKRDLIPAKVIFR